MKDPYRVIIWGPGSVGTAVLKCLHGRPDFTIAGVLCHSDHKVGIDVGTYIGRDPIGVALSNDREAVFALDADVVIYTGMVPIDHEQMDRDILQLLASGKNVISASAYWYPHLKGPDYVARIEEACRKGRSSLHGSGELPGVFLDRVAMAMTGVCMNVESLRLEEWFDVSSLPVPLMNMFGLGVPEAAASQAVPMVEPMLLRAYHEEISLIAHTLFEAPTDVRIATTFEVSDGPIALPGGTTLPPGLVSMLRFGFIGTVGSEDRFEIVLNWSLGKPERWQIEIEGDPVSLRADIHAFATLKGDQRFRAGDTTCPGHYATAVPLVQAIPQVVAAQPGIVYPTIFTSAKKDYRTL
ncbi:hypothetical protein OKA06_11615 [Novosphingobium sp. MW5]|nr:hypothetical protein [Novosphingobium sp. MW5]